MRAKEKGGLIRVYFVSKVTCAEFRSNWVLFIKTARKFGAVNLVTNKQNTSQQKTNIRNKETNT